MTESPSHDDPRLEAARAAVQAAAATDVPLEQRASRLAEAQAMLAALLEQDEA
jgi:hypothetical protein